VLHVADGVQVDQEAHAGDQQAEDRGERVEQQPELDLQAADLDEVVEIELDGAVVQVAEREEVQQRQHEAGEHAGDAQPVREGLRAAAEQQDEAAAGQRDGHQQPHAAQQPRGGGVFNRVFHEPGPSSTSAGWRRRRLPSAACGRSS
jgi:hypothetical protein